MGAYEARKLTCLIKISVPEKKRKKTVAMAIVQIIYLQPPKYIHIYTHICIYVYIYIYITFKSTNIKFIELSSLMTLSILPVNVFAGVSIFDERDLLLKY